MNPFQLIHYTIYPIKKATCISHIAFLIPFSIVILSEAKNLLHLHSENTWYKSHP